MKNTSDIDGLSRKQRLEEASTVIPLQVLEDDFSVLLSRILHRSDKFAALYCYQPLVILSEIENFGLTRSEEAFHFLKNTEQKAAYVYKLIVRIEDWRKRLEYACINTSSLELLKDLNAQIRDNIAPYFSLFRSQYISGLPNELGKLGKIWSLGGQKTRLNTNANGFMRRFLMLLLGSIKMLQKNSAVYREEICSSGMMDPSLAVVVAFLKNYGEIAGRFNNRWQQLPYIYLEQMMKVAKHPEALGRVWLTFDKSPVVNEVLIPAGTYLPTVDPSVLFGYKLFSDIYLSDISVEGVEMVVIEKSKERHPEIVLNYATSLLRIDITNNKYTPVAIGAKIESNVLLLREGERSVSMTCKLTKQSFDEFKLLIYNVSLAESDAGKTISPGEALFKILSDSFSLEVTTSSCWRAVCNFQTRFMEREQSFLFQFHLNRNFPALEPLETEELPAVRLLVNNTAWLFPYSWARSIFFESVHIKTDVCGVRDIQLYNDLGQIDTKQPFTPFGVQPEKGAWLVFGSYEMACKSITNVALSFDWQQLPTDMGGLRDYYKTYNQMEMEEITNQSFRVRTEYLQNDEWKQTSIVPHYLFHTRKMMEDGAPEPDSPLMDSASIVFDVPELSPLHLSDPANFRFGLVRSGFYRLVLTSPEIGFGEKHYRRIFTEVMMHNSRFRKKLPIPEPPVSPLMDALQLSYTAEEECVFTIGQVCPMRISYINPISTGADINPDTTRPMPLLQGPSDEANIIIAFSGVMGQNVIRMYVEMELLQREIDHEQLPETYWYYKSGGKWVQLPPSGVLIDDTGHLMHSGGVELQLPHPVSEEMLDDDGLFRITVSVRKNLSNCSYIKQIHVNVAEVGVAGVPGKETAIPAVLGVRQITSLQGAVQAESKEEMKARISERMSHRNRALLPEDYEQMTLQAFPEITKVKCISGVDAKKQGRHGVVTLALVCNAVDEQLPLCEDRLLWNVEGFLQQYTSPFVIIDAINPVYEEVTVFCGITLRTGCSAGMAIADIHKSINYCIAPWFVQKDIPAFGYSFSMRDLYSQIRKSKYVEKLHGIKLAHVTEDIHGAYYLNKEMPGDSEEITIAPSEPWCILVPAARQYVIICTEEEWSENLEYGDLELGRTFVIA